MVKDTGLNVLVDDTVKAGDMNIDYSDIIALYMMGICIGGKSSRKIRFYVKANEWRKWA